MSKTRQRSQQVQPSSRAVQHNSSRVRPRRVHRRTALLCSVSGLAFLANLGATPRAVAGSPPTFSPAWYAGRTVSGTTGGSAATAQPSMQAVQQSLTNLQTAAQSIATMQRVQAQARAAAAATAVPNGLTTGGLQPSAGSANPASANAWTNANQPSQSSSGGRTTVTIQQTAKTATLNWQTFNVGPNTTLNFSQSLGGAAANTWVALNRVSDPTAQPSQILGQINAPGQVYILNGNGIIFGATAQVNTGALIAATGALSSSQFANFGIYSNLSGTTYQPSFTGATAPVTVQAGAQITTNTPFSATNSGGFVMLLGSGVQNAGQITTPSGQTILAAGKDFILRTGYSVTGLDPHL
jgi:filamentous hemagglutinin family protein